MILEITNVTTIKEIFNDRIIISIINNSDCLLKNYITIYKRYDNL